MAGKDTIRMSTEALEELCGQLNKLKAELSRQSSEIRSIANRIDRASGGELRISMNLKLSVCGNVSGGDTKSLLQALDKTMNACSGESGRIMKAVSTAEAMFRENEERIIKKIEEIAVGAQSGFGSGASGASGVQSGSAVQTKGSNVDIDWRIDDLLRSIFTGMGTVGNFFYSLATVGATPGGLAKFLVNGSECVAEWSKIAKGFSKLKNFGTGYAVKTYAKKLLGLNSYAASMGFAASKASTLADRFVSNLTRSGGFAKGMKSVAAWAVEGIDRGFENYKEYASGYKDGGTAIAEWAAETGLGVAAGAGAVAAVGAAIPAAPALAVAAIGGAVVWGVDTAWANTIGRGADEDGGNEGLIEMVGEGVVEGGKYIADKSYEIGQKIGDALYDGIESAKAYFAGRSGFRAVWM